MIVPVFNADVHHSAKIEMHPEMIGTSYVFCVSSLVTSD